MNNETELQHIMRKTGRKVSECKCQTCKGYCHKVPGIGTPTDIMNLIDAGYSSRLRETIWRAGRERGQTNLDIAMIQVHFDPEKKACTFFKDGLCELHDLGLKPTECKLTHHSRGRDNTNPAKSISWQVARTWMDIGPEALERITNFISQ